MKHSKPNLRVSLRRSIFRLLPTILLAAFALTGCSLASGGLSTSPASLTFGNVALGSSRNQSLTVTNSGVGTITITRAVASGEGFTVKGPSLPLVLAEGQSTTFTTAFKPAAIGDASGSLLITKTQADAPKAAIENEPVTASISTRLESILMTGAGVPVTPSITAQPASQTVAAGRAATFQVVASSDAPLNYQWRKNGVAISGATSSSYSTPAMTASESGSQFSVTVSNPAGDVTSNDALLTVGGAGQLTASAAKLSFGSVTVGSTNILPVTITNTGSSSVSISNVTISGAGLSVAGVSSGMILAQGNSAVLDVTFAPSASGTLSGSVNIASNASNSTVTVSLSGAAAQQVSHSVTLNLTPDSADVAGYNVYRSSTANGPYTRLNSPVLVSTTYTDTTVLADETYFYVGTSVDTSGNETAYSNQVAATIPAH